MIKQIDVEKTIIAVRKELNNNANIFSDASIESGKMGYALFYYYCQKYFDDNKFLSKGESIIEETINMLSKTSFDNQNSPKYKGDSIAQTLSSFGRGLLFIQNNFDHHYDFSENYSYLNDILNETTKQAIERRDHDYFSGSLATGYYFLTKYTYDSDPYSKRVLNEIVNSIIRHTIFNTEKEAYWNAPTYNNQVFLGLSHGSAMIINFLTKILDYRIYEGENSEIKEILYKAISFVINRKRNLSNGFFPHKFPPRKPMIETQLSMCYGDLGVLFVLYNAVKTCKFYELEEGVEQLLFITSRRKLNIAHTKDASILYGCSGLYHIFKEIYKRTSNDIYLASLQYWHKQIFSFWHPHKKTLAGFQFEYEDNLDIDASAKYSFFWGIGGIGITLMQGSNGELPKLNELLLIGV